MNNPFPLRLKSARKLKSFSLQDLADALSGKLSRQALHKYEQGETMPDSETLQLLGVALGVRPEYFMRSTKVELGEVEFRKTEKLPAKEIERIKEETREYLERYLELEEILGIETTYKNELEKGEPIADFKGVDKAARELREKWMLGLDPIYNVAELLEDHHIKVVELHADFEFDGLQTWVNDNIPVIAYNKAFLQKSDRIRFTLLHELGHLLLGKRFAKMTKNQEEKLCHKFASAMLLPQESLEVELGNHRRKLFIPELGNIKKQYGASMQAIVMRAADLGIVNQNYKRTFFQMMAQHNWRETEPIDYEGQESSNRFDQLIFRALAEDQISMSKAAEFKNQKLAEFRRSHILVQ